MIKSDSKTSWTILGAGVVIGVVIGLVVLRLLPSTNTNSDSVASLPPQLYSGSTDNVQVEISADSTEHHNEIADTSSLETLLSGTNRSDQVLALYQSVNSMDVSRLIAKIAFTWFEQQGELSLKNISGVLEKYTNYTDAISLILAKIGRDNPGHSNSTFLHLFNDFFRKLVA
ncbi:MAG: hypothetical protein OXG88_03860, partial [Gammaproteobacteria bacterium]|nr:hypothetical protein [Gammaproteobacteria bacterium]